MYACLKSYSRIVAIDGSFTLSANRFLYLMKCWLKSPVNSGSLGFIFLVETWVCSLVINSGVIFIGGLGLQPFVDLAVIVFWSGCRFVGVIPLSPTISMGRKPVCAIMSISIDSFLLLVDVMRICIFSLVGGWMPVGSRMYFGFSHFILNNLQ